MTDSSTSLISSTAPRREWLTRCVDSWQNLAVCAVSANRGRVEFVGPEGEMFVLDSPDQIAGFRDCLDAAIRQVDADLRHG